MSKPFDPNTAEISDRFTGLGDLSAEEADAKLRERGLMLLPYVRQGTLTWLVVEA